MKKLNKILLVAGVLFVVVLVLYFPVHSWAREHVYSKTGVRDHPLSCGSCHIYTQKTGLVSKLINEDYYSPFNLTVSKDGRKLYVVAGEGNALLIVDTEKNKVLDKIKVGDHPYRVILDNSERTAYVSNQWSDNVSVIDLVTSRVVDTLKTGNGPAGIALSSDRKVLYVVNSFASSVSLIDLNTKEEIKRLDAGNNPTAIQLSPEGNDLYVTSRRAGITPFGETLKSEITVVNDIIRRVSQRKIIESAYLMENVAFTPKGDLAMVTLVRPKNNLPTIQVEKGWMMTYGIGIVERKENGRIIQLLIDEPNAFYPNPYDIVITADGKKAFVSSSGNNCISVLDIDSIRVLISRSTPEMLKVYSNHLGISSQYVQKRIYTGANPKGLALSHDGRLLYVAENLEDRITVINTESLEIVNTINLGGPKRITVARKGQRLFNNAGHTFQYQYSCFTCHPDGHEDGLLYNMGSKNMGRNVTNTQSLRDIGDTAPYKWTGLNSTVYRQDGIRFSTVLTRTEPFNSKDLDALVAYIITGIPYPPNLQYNPTGELNEIQLRGKAIFERTHDINGKEIPLSNRCTTCHPAPYFTNLKMFDVGTLAASDDSMLFDTPHLNNIYASPPYLHTGDATTLEEIWTRHNGDKHGVADDLTKIQLNELVEYLRSLGGPDYYTKGSDKYREFDNTTSSNNY